MNDRIRVYVFHDEEHFVRGSCVTVSAAPLDAVVSFFGCGGLKGEGSLLKAFGKAAFFRDDTTGDCYLGVWGSRSASQFRGTIRRAGISIEITNTPPPARLIWVERATAKRVQSYDVQWRLARCAFCLFLFSFSCVTFQPMTVDRTVTDRMIACAHLLSLPIIE